jgi:hypothetical protein
MRHRHLNHDQLTPAAIDAIIQRGLLADWVRLAAVVRGRPGGEISATIRTICEARRIDSEAPRQSYAFWRHYLDHHHL